MPIGLDGVLRVAPIDQVADQVLHGFGVRRMGGGVRRLAAGLAFGRTAEESVRLDPGQALESGENGLEVRGRIGHVPACGSGRESGVRQGPSGVVERVPVGMEAQEDEAFFPVDAVFEVQGEGHGWLLACTQSQICASLLRSRFASRTWMLSGNAS